LYNYSNYNHLLTTRVQITFIG